MIKSPLFFLLVLLAALSINCNRLEPGTQLLANGPRTERMAVMNIIQSIEQLKSKHPELYYLQCHEEASEEKVHPDSLNKLRATTLFYITEDTTGYLYYENNIKRQANPAYDVNCSPDEGTNCPPPYLEQFNEEYALKMRINFIAKQNLISRPLAQHFTIGDLIVELQEYQGANRELLGRIIRIIEKEKYYFERASK